MNALGQARPSKSGLRSEARAPTHTKLRRGVRRAALGQADVMVFARFGSRLRRESTGDLLEVRGVRPAAAAEHLEPLVVAQT